MFVELKTRDNKEVEVSIDSIIDGLKETFNSPIYAERIDDETMVKRSETMNPETGEMEMKEVRMTENEIKVYEALAVLENYA